MMRRSSVTALVAHVLLTLLVASSGLAAELRLRESLLQQQRDKATITVTATVSHLGDEAHPLATQLSSEDCDLHVPLRSRDIRVPFIGEVKNACSEVPSGEGVKYWHDAIYDETHGVAAEVAGVFRIWLEHPPKAPRDVQSEAVQVPSYTNSNPDHQLELHPILQIGTLDFRGHVKQIKEGQTVGKGYGTAQLATVLNKMITIQRIRLQDEPYIRIRGVKSGYNHWTLRGTVSQAPEALADGSVFRVDIPGVAKAKNIPVVSIEGTAAHQQVQTLNVGDPVRFLALVRMHVATVLNEVSTTARQIPLPIEFILLHLE